VSSTSEPRRKSVGCFIDSRSAGSAEKGTCIDPPGPHVATSTVRRGDGSFDCYTTGIRCTTRSSKSLALETPFFKDGEEARVAGRSNSRQRDGEIGLVSLSMLQGIHAATRLLGSTRHAESGRSRFSRASGDAAIGAVPSEFLENVFRDLVTSVPHLRLQETSLCHARDAKDQPLKLALLPAGPLTADLVEAPRGWAATSATRRRSKTHPPVALHTRRPPGDHKRGTT
jgi:hypothetical protein